MTNIAPWQEILAHPAAKDHIVQLYEDDGFLARTVAEYVITGWKKDAGAILVMTPAHWDLLRERLAASGVDVAAALRQGRLRVLDAAETLAKFLVNDAPDTTLFRDIVGSAIQDAAQAAPSGELRAFGEMVDLLWQSGRVTSAIRLEQLWNELAREYRFSLFCAYKVSPWDPVLSERESRGIFREHTHLIPGDDYNRLNRAVDAALQDVLGQDQVQALKPLLTGNLSRLAVMPGAQSTILWLRDNLPGTVEDVLTRARHHYESASVHACAELQSGF